MENSQTISANQVTICGDACYGGRKISFNAPMVSDAASEEKSKVLGEYFGDIYLMFLREVTAFSIKAESTDAEHARLKSLLNELIRVRTDLQGK
ncbi:MAG: hypothetical protein A3B23_02270 [Candidatus Colwellbacteria bacterium RIFCSPLOWO2_01_FULL_48_10]|uniref:Uncharacterized protein n=2 Tax=Bacteria candidate phyla TaxID=1783234 RepID=A0A1F5P3V1_9BACT|nr:MAG: hypothetical protein A2846_03625 [Candidatus Doudnabacteria bacterium RIFCSPHIGHO2_01_FULL_49_9]OGY59951.1 MAG: hypothetical protein A3B23_02270 [Candidatus Colwellbacteria bacterium RIFCSPLOWO2_01_FULL_48_10]